jgi:sugar O-acyltransferase (sialic acid O-acetyltransferase NeuD family)
MSKKNPTTEARKPCVLLGVGGHARALLDAIGDDFPAYPTICLDKQRSLWGTRIQGIPIRGGDSLLPRIFAAGTRRFIVGIGGTGDNRPRRGLFELARQHGLRPLSIIHRHATISRSARIAEGAQILAGAIVCANARIAGNAIVNTGAIVEHDCRIKAHAHIAPGAVLCGGITVGIGAHIGAGATVIQGLVIGAWAVVGAGAVVTRNVPPRAVVVGVPARRVGG